MSHFPHGGVRFYLYSHYSKVNFIRNGRVWLFYRKPKLITTRDAREQCLLEVTSCVSHLGDSRVMPHLHVLHGSPLANLPWTVEGREEWKANVILPFLVTMQKHLVSLLHISHWLALSHLAPPIGKRNSEIAQPCIAQHSEKCSVVNFIVVQIPQSTPIQICMGELIPLSYIAILWDYRHMSIVDQNIVGYMYLFQIGIPK